ncbi:MmgE/PrpD family protein [Planctomycetota bacterium]
MQSNLLHRLAAFVADTKAGTIPARVRTAARRQALSVAGAVLSTRATALADTILAAAPRDQGAVRLWSDPEVRVGVDRAVWTHASLSCAHDFDDYLFLGHTGHSAVTVPLAMAEQLNATLAEATTATVLANEVAGRLGAACLLGPQNGQLWTFVHLAAAAAAAARMLDLDRETTWHALAIALAHPPRALWASFLAASATKATFAASPALEGLRAARLAQAGMQGPTDILDHPQGFFRHFAFHPLRGVMTGLGKAWVTETLAYKIYPGCAYIDTTVDAILALRGRFIERVGRDPIPDDLVSLDVRTTVLSTSMSALARLAGDSLHPNRLNFSIHENAAIAWIRGRLSPREMEPSWLQTNGPLILGLAARVSLTHDWALTHRLLDALERSVSLSRLLAEVPLRAWLQMPRRAREAYSGASPLGGRDLPRLLGLLLPVARRSLTHRKWPYDLGEQDLSRLTLPFAALLRARYRDGERDEHLALIPVGAPGRAFSETAAAVAMKARGAPGRPPTKDERAVHPYETLPGSTPVDEALTVLLGEG